MAPPSHARDRIVATDRRALNGSTHDRASRLPAVVLSLADGHIANDDLLPAKRGTRDRQRCDARREGAKHRRDVLPARCETSCAGTELPVAGRKQDGAAPRWGAGKSRILLPAQ
jgi:hypothetical protein